MEWKEGSASFLLPLLLEEREGGKEGYRRDLGHLSPEGACWCCQ